MTVYKKYQGLINMQNLFHKCGFPLQLVDIFQKKKKKKTRTDNTEDNMSHKEKWITLEKVAFAS